jgi:hypothetical protein
VYATCNQARASLKGSLVKRTPCAEREGALKQRTQLWTLSIRYTASLASVTRSKVTYAEQHRPGIRSFDTESVSPARG